MDSMRYRTSKILRRIRCSAWKVFEGPGRGFCLPEAQTAFVGLVGWEDNFNDGNGLSAHWPTWLTAIRYVTSDREMCRVK